MGIEQVSIIFPDAARIPEIKSWLNPYASVVHISSFTNLVQAVPAISQSPCDLLIAADNFPQAQGSILLAGLHKLCPNAQIIMLAASPTPIEGLFITARQNARLLYLPQPWDKQSLTAHLEAIIGRDASTSTTSLALENEEYERISQLLEELQNNVSARSIYLVTDLGEVLDFKGSELSQVGEISSLLGGSFAALQQLSTTLGEQGSAANLIQRLGGKEDLYALSVGRQALLVLRFSSGPDAPRIGTVALYARQTVAELSKVLVDLRPSKPLQNQDSEAMKAALSTELENLFTVNPDDAEQTKNKSRAAGRLLDYEQALKKGLITKSLIARFGSRNEIH